MKPLRWRLPRALAAWEYGPLVPASGRRPLPLGRVVARLRGRLNAGLDCDWPTVSLRHHFLTARLADRPGSPDVRRMRLFAAGPVRIAGSAGAEQLPAFPIAEQAHAV